MRHTVLASPTGLTTELGAQALTRFDRHVDHQLTYKFLVQAVADVQTSDPTYQPYIHSAIVHTISKNFGAWPDLGTTSPNWSGPTIPNGPFVVNLDPATCTTTWPECDSNGEYTWDQRETYVVPASMQLTFLPSNVKSQAVESHTTQTAISGFIRRFVRMDEVFWVERIGTPEGRDDSGYSVNEGASINVAASGVLRNDVRGVGATPGAMFSATALGPMSAVLVQNVTNGSLTLNTDGSFTYIHDGSETLTDSFTYRTAQGAVQDSVAATVSLTINPVDDDPIAVDDGPYTVSNGALLTVAVPGVLGNDSDPEALALTAVLVSDVSNGSLTLNTVGSFTYTHDGLATMSDSFTYNAKDPAGNLSAVATVSITIADIAIGVMVDGASFGAPGVAASFSATVSGGTGSVLYAWSVERLGAVVATGSGTSMDFTPTLGGTHIVKVTVTDDVGSDSAEVDLTVLGDIAGSGFITNILWLAEAGITKGCNPPTNDNFCPDDPVTRAQMAAFLHRASAFANP